MIMRVIFVLIHDQTRQLLPKTLLSLRMTFSMILTKSHLLQEFLRLIPILQSLKIKLKLSLYNGNSQGVNRLLQFSLKERLIPRFS